MICGKVDKLNKGIHNGFVNHLEKTNLAFGSYNQVFEAVRKIPARIRGE